MSIRSRATRSLTPRKMFVTTSLTIVAAFGFVIAAPGSDAFAAGPTSPQERVAASLEHGHLLDDVTAGRITDADMTAVGKTGLDVDGRHIDGWEDLTPEQEAAQAKSAAELGAALDADPEAASTMQALASAQSDGQVAASLDGTDTVSYRPAPLAANAPVTESKHWWSRFIPHIHIPPIHIHVPPIVIHVPPIHIPQHSVFINNKLIRSFISALGGGLAGVICVMIPDLSKLTCVIMAAAMAGLIEYVKTNGICGGHGLTVEYPIIRKHCGH
ncbi:hypothetical protein [Clavibacter nebraskensis]|uniref:hypothetical protein n=1 Tax=Clavibacter nebraskensis TaxID=31963 RepID=UPI003F854F83